MIPELQQVVLTRAVPSSGLEPGDMGVVVHRYAKEGYEVEFVALDGETIAVTTLMADEVRPVASKEVAHARPLSV